MSKPNRVPTTEPVTAPGRRLVSLERAAEYLDVSVMSMRRYIHSGTIVGYRLGGRLLRVDLNEIDAMLMPAYGSDIDGGAA